MSKQKHAIVIGSGFGGIAAAIRLQASGVRTTLLEKRDLPGGRAYVYKEAGYTFDAGPTVITAPHCIEELFEAAGKRMSDYVELLPVTPFYRLAWDDGYRFDYVQDMEQTMAQIRAKSPEDVDGYRRFLEYSKRVFDAGYTNLVHVPFLKLWDMVRVSPELMKLQAFRSVYSMVSSYIKDPHLRQAFSFHSLLVGGNPFTTSSIYTLIHYLERNWGVSFPRGGTGALVEGLIRLFTDIGGTVRLNSEIDEILTTNGKSSRVTGIKLVSGEKIEADLVVSNADVMHTYGKLLRSQRDLAATRKKMAKSRFSMSLFLIYFGTTKQYPDIAHHTIVFGPRYRELLADIFERGIIADDFSLYLHRPTATDPTMAPPGTDSFYVLSPVPHLGAAPIDWKKKGPEYADKILAYLEKHHLPGVRKSIAVQRIFTPEDFREVLNSHLGAAFSLEPRLTQSAYFRVKNRDPKVKGLYFVGAGTHPGAGVPGVINSAKATAQLIINDL